MSWLPDPTKFLRRSYRKGDGDHHEKPAKSKGAAKPAGGTISKHSSLYSLMQASTTPSLERSAEDDNPSMHGALESTTSNTCTNDLSSHSRGDVTDLALIRHAANVLISNVPVPQVPAQHATKDGSAQDAPPHGIKDPPALHSRPDASASQEYATREPLAEDEGIKEEEPLLAANAKQGVNVILEEGTISLAAPANSENEHTDESECKVISEDLAASKASPEGKAISPSSSSDAKEKRKGKGNREHSKRNSPVGGGRNDANYRKSSEPEKSRQPSSRKTSRRGEGKKSSSKKSPHAEQIRHNPKMDMERGASSPHSQSMEYRKGELSPSLTSGDQPLILQDELHAELLMVDDTLQRERFYNHKHYTNPDGKKNPFLVPTVGKAPTSPLMPHRSFALQDGELGMGELARISIGHDVPGLDSKERSPISIAGLRLESSSPLMQHHSFSFQEIEFMEDKARSSIGDEALDLISRQRSPSMAGNRASKFPSLQESETMGNRKKISISHNTTEQLSRRRSPSRVARRDPSSLVILHQDFSLQDHEMMRERARISASYNSMEFSPRRQSPSIMAAQRDLLSFPWTPLHQISLSQESEINGGERARTSMGYEARQQAGSRRQSQLALARRETNSPLTPHQNYSLRDHEMIQQRERISFSGDDEQELGLRRQSPFTGGRNKSNSPLMQHHNFLLPDTEERPRRSLGRDIDMGLGSRGPNPFMVAMRESKPRMVSSERFYFQEDELRSVYDRPPSPFLASQASLLQERQGSVFIDDIPSLPLPASRQFFLQKGDLSGTGQYYEPNSPLIASKHYVLQEDQKAYNNKPISKLYLPSCKNSSHRAEGVYAEHATSPMLSNRGFYSQDDPERGYDEDTGSANKRSSFYHEGWQGQSISRDNHSSPLMSQRRETHDMFMQSNDPFFMQESEEALYHEQLAAESNELIGNDVFSDDDDDAEREILTGEDDAMALLQHYMRSAEMQSLQEQEDGSELHLEDKVQLSQLYADVLSENSINSGYSKKQRSSAARSKAQAYISRSPLSENSRKSYSKKHRSKEALINNAEAMCMQSPLSEASSSLSSGKRMMKKLKEAQMEIAMVRRARRGFEEMVVKMVGSGGGGGGEEDYAVQNLLDLEEFVGGYESLSSSCGIFKGVVDQFFHELCCELLQPVSHEDDRVLSMALLRLEQMCSSPLL